jgi:hypothetical protein
MAKNLHKPGHMTTANLLFPHKSLLQERFLQTDLGELYQAIPFDALATQIPMPAHSMSGRGRKPWFDIKGAIGLIILKHYLGISDALLIERINTDWSMQMFCGITLHPAERIADTNLPSYWRGYIGKHLDIAALQQQLAIYWKPYMSETNIGMQDATCYESRIAFPTDIKLLWQSCNEIYLLLGSLRKQLRLRKSRCNYDKQRNVYLHYQKSRKKTRRQEKKMRKKLLKFLLRLTETLEQLRTKHKIVLTSKQNKIVKTVLKVYEQQHQRAYGDNSSIQDRIVSLRKPYVRPIIRGKESKPVEFGAKVNKLLVDGISFIEHISFDAFNESTRFTQGVHLQRKLFGKCTHHSADAIYATNKNRKYCTKEKITTNFIPKGKQKLQHIEQSKIMRTQLNKQRSTVLEGSFGNDKNHYLLQKINARNRDTEVCWIFFGMLTANASKIAKRIVERSRQARAA